MSWMYPLWIGIVGNLLLTAVNIGGLKSHWGPFYSWYFDGKGGLWLMGGMWAVLLPWSAFNYFAQ